MSDTEETREDDDKRDNRFDPLTPGTTFRPWTSDRIKMKTVKKPGYMKRATFAWFVLNAAMFTVLGAITYFLAPFLTAWYVIGPIVISVVVTEWVITAETIAPIVRDWITQEEYIEEGKKPSWEV